MSENSLFSFFCVFAREKRRRKGNFKCPPRRRRRPDSFSFYIPPRHRLVYFLVYFAFFVKKEKKGMREKKERVFARLRKKVLIAFLELGLVPIVERLLYFIFPFPPWLGMGKVRTLFLRPFMRKLIAAIFSSSSSSSEEEEWRNKILALTPKNICSTKRFLNLSTAATKKSDATSS